MQDPMGIPFYAPVFQVLLVLTFALHILFVNFALGTLSVSIYGYIRGEANWLRLASSLAKATTTNISLAMLFGVAPLLFVQVLYDPFWYTSNLLSAVWVIGFVFIMMIAYGLTYVFYLKGGPKKGIPVVFGIVALVLFIIAGVIMHALGYQLLQPEKWLEWYVRQGKVDTSGSVLHAFQLPRFLHFLVPSFAMTGLFLMLYAWYFRHRSDFTEDYLIWVGKLGAKMAFLFTTIQVIVGFWWLLSLPSTLAFTTNPVFLVALFFGVTFLFFLYYIQGDPIRYAVSSIPMALLTIGTMAYARETLRTKYLASFGYTIFRYKTNLDWGSTVLFFLTFVVGLVVVGYFLATVYKAGKSRETYEATAFMNRWGKLSIALLLVWLAVVVTFGLVITLRS